MSDSAIFRIVASDPGNQARRFVSSLGIEEELILLALQDAVDEIGEICLNAVHAAVPWESNQLHDAIELKSMNKRTSAKFTADIESVVEIRNGIHTESRGSLLLNNITLANILDEGETTDPDKGSDVYRDNKRDSRPRKLHRSRDSQAAGDFPGGIFAKGQSTANWIEYAQELALEKLGKE